MSGFYSGFFLPPSGSTVVMDKILAYLGNGTTNTTTAGWQKVPVDTVSYDTNGLWDSANKRIVPKKPGYYQVTIRSRTPTQAPMAAAIALNGAIYLAGGTDSSYTKATGGTAMVYCNGTTDFLESWIFCDSVRTYSGSLLDTYFQVMGPF